MVMLDAIEADFTPCASFFFYISTAICVSNA